MPYVLWFAESGGKNSKISGKEGASMGELLNAGVPVPPGFIITSDACREFIRASKLGRKIQRSIKDAEIYDKEKLAKLSGEICEMLSTAEIPKEIERGIKAAFATLRGNDSEFTVSVKCSTEQDCGHECYASRGVSDADSIMKEALKCWESIYSPEAILQREENGLRHDDAGIAVVVQKLVLPDKCGTVMTIEGPENRDVLMVSARYGEGVKGPEDVYKVRKKDYTIIGKSVCDQRFMAVQVDGKTVHTNVREDLRAQQKISDKQIVELAKIGLLIEKQYGGPRMARWAIADGHFYITETAPVEECRGKPSELQEIEFEEHASIVIGPAGVIGATAITGVCVCALVSSDDDAENAAKYADAGILAAGALLAGGAGISAREAVERGMQEKYINEMCARICGVARILYPKPLIYRMGCKSHSDSMFSLELRAVKKAREKYGLSNISIMLGVPAKESAVIAALEALDEAGVKRSSTLKVWTEADANGNARDIKAVSRLVDVLMLTESGKDDVDLAALQEIKDTASLCVFGGKTAAESADYAYAIVERGVGFVCVPPEFAHAAKMNVASAEKKLVIGVLRELTQKKK